MKRGICLFAAAALGYLCSIAVGQSQPGDVAAPVVDVFETGLLTASITCEPTVRAGAAVTFDVSGTSDGDLELLIRPGVPDDAIVFDTGGEAVYAWVAREGNYAAVWVVTDGRDVATDTVYFEVVAGVPPTPPPPPPPDDEFVAFVGKALEEVEAANHAEVAATFRAVADRIDRGELRLSEQIRLATEAALFGPKKTLNKEWVGFYNTVFREMLVEMNLGLPEQWSAAYKTIAKEVSP